MNTMPGFTAEASLSEAREVYLVNGEMGRQGSMVEAAYYDIDLQSTNYFPVTTNSCIRKLCFPPSYEWRWFNGYPVRIWIPGTCFNVNLC